MFAGRKKELNYLKEYYDKGVSSVLVVYGHKGVGKTTLLKRFAAGKRFHYYCASVCAEDEQLLLWGRTLKGAEDPTRTGYDAILHRMLPAEGEEKHLLVIDEFQNIIRGSESFLPSLLRFLKQCPYPVMTVLMSSSISFVENDLVSRIGSLALGINAFYKVPELGFMDCVNYFKDYTTRECMEVYSILGGIPAYWEYFNTHVDVEDNIREKILKAGSPLREEGYRLVAAELREMNVYCTILYCLANGMNKLNDLHIHTGYSRAKISVYLKNLIERELVEKVFSFDNASAENAKKGIYRITLRTMQFYFRFLFPNMSYLELMECGEFYRSFVAPGMASYHQENFRKVCGEYLDILNRNKMLPIRAVKTGEWVGKEGSIDIVMQDAEWESLLAFCDWESSEITEEDLSKALRTINQARLHPDYVYFFAAGRFSEGLKRRAKEQGSITLIDIDTL